jgi:alkyl hydroperoxide reductase subunit AhpF
MLDLTKNETFINEYKSWFNKINSIEDENQKNDLMNLLKELANEVKKVEFTHQDLLLNRKTVNANENKNRILELRKKIANRVGNLR